MDDNDNSDQEGGQTDLNSHSGRQAPAEPAAEAAQAASQLAGCDLRQSSSAASLYSDEDSGRRSAASVASGLFGREEDEQPVRQAVAATASAPLQLAATLRSSVQMPAGASSDQAGEASEQHLLSSSKHVFVFSTAGKPIYSYRGDESRLAGLMATAEAILSVAHSKGHALKHIR
jgi:hypothetical protein